MVLNIVSKYTGIYCLNLDSKYSYNCCDNNKVSFSIKIAFTNDECTDDFISKCKFDSIQNDIESKWKNSSDNYPEKDNCQVEYFKTTDNKKFIIVIESK